MASTLMVRKTGSDNNGGTSAAVRSSASDGVTNGTNTFTSASASWSSGDIGHGININGQTRRITAVGSSTSLTFNGPTISSATSVPWVVGGAFATVNKMFGTGVTNWIPTGGGGDLFVIGAGIHPLSAGASLTVSGATGNPTIIRGDIDGLLTGDPGEVILSMFNSGNSSAPVQAVALSVNANFVTIEKLTIRGGGSVGTAQYACIKTVGHDFVVQDCALFPFDDSNPIWYDGSGNSITQAGNVIIRRCFCICQLEGIQISMGSSSSGSGDVNDNILIENCFIHVGEPGTGGSIRVGGGFFTARKKGGVTIRHCTITNPGPGIHTTGNIPTGFPVDVKNCYFAGTGLGATTSQETFRCDSATGTLVEDYNVIYGSSFVTAYVNVTQGTHTIVGDQGAFMHWGHLGLYGFSNVPFGQPTSDSVARTYGSYPSGTTTEDIYGSSRPATASQRSAGAFEYANPWTKETGTVRTGSNSISVTGFGWTDFDVDVDAVSTTFSIYMRYDSNYTGTKPSLSVIKGTECGVTSATSTMTVAANAWEQLSLTFTPTSQGIVTLRLLSSDTSGVGKAFADDRSVS